MNESRYGRRDILIVLILLFMILLSIVAWYRPGGASAAPTTQYLPCATIECVDGRLVAVLARIDKAENEVRLAAEADRQAKTLTEQRIGEIAWAKAGDRLDLWKRESAAYTDTWFYDQTYLRWRTHACRNGVPIRAACP